MSYDEAAHYIWELVGSRDWVGFPVVIRATPLTLAESKVRISDTCEFIRSLTMSKAQLDHEQTQDILRTNTEQERVLQMELT